MIKVRKWISVRVRTFRFIEEVNKRKNWKYCDCEEEENNKVECEK